MKIRAVPASPTGGKPTWYGEYNIVGSWRIVRNNSNYPIAYASEEAALGGATLAWCKGLFASLNEGAKWTIPRSGLVFQRRGDTLYLIERFPYGSRVEQQKDYKATRQHFVVAGVYVDSDLNMED